jgi:predicted GTPase
LRETYESYPHLQALLPAMGYGAQQVAELEQTINRADCDLVLVASPVDLRQLITINRPGCRVSYEFEECGTPMLAELITETLRKAEGR